jgi:hypothetical protein
MFGLVDNNDDWLTSYNAAASFWTEGASNSRSISSTYSLTGVWTDSILTYGEYWFVGDTIDITFNFSGVFKPVNFDVNNFGMSVGLDQSYNIVPSELNQITGVGASVDVPEPSSLAIFAAALLGLVRLRKKA